jgi:hypothetical protein
MNVSVSGLSVTVTAAVLASVLSSTPRVRTEFAIQAVEAMAHKKKARRTQRCTLDGFRLVTTVASAICPRRGQNA